MIKVRDVMILNFSPAGVIFRLAPVHLQAAVTGPSTHRSTDRVTARGSNRSNAAALAARGPNDANADCEIVNAVSAG